MWAQTARQADCGAADSGVGGKDLAAGEGCAASEAQGGRARREAARGKG